MPAFVARYANAFADVVTDAKLDAAAIDRQFSDFLASWEGSAELRTFFVNPAAPAVQKVEILDKLNAKLGMQKELRNLLAVLISNNRIGHVVEVAAAYRRILQQHVHAAEAHARLHVLLRELRLPAMRAADSRLFEVLDVHGDSHTSSIAIGEENLENAAGGSVIRVLMFRPT